MRDSRDRLFLPAAVGVALIAVGAAIVYAATADSEAARRTLEMHGFTDVAFKDHSAMGEFHGCADREVWHGARAYNPRGERVDVSVCCGAFLKSCTVRSP